jgi:hypothetical protein
MVSLRLQSGCNLLPLSTAPRFPAGCSTINSFYLSFRECSYFNFLGQSNVTNYRIHKWGREIFLFLLTEHILVLIKLSSVSKTEGWVLNRQLIVVSTVCIFIYGTA